MFLLLMAIAYLMVQNSEILDHTDHVQKALPRSCMTESRRYVIGVSYWEQFGMAARNMFQLVTMANDWESRVVEPYSVDSRLFGLREIIFRRNPSISDRVVAPLLFREMVNLDQLNEAMCRYGLPGLVKHEEFMSDVPQDIIIIQFVHTYSNPSDLNVPPDMKADILDRFKSKSIIDCGQLLSHYRDKIVVALEQETKMTPLVRQYYCVDATRLTSSHKLAELTTLLTYPHITVVIVDWHGYSSRTMVYHSAKGPHVNKRVTLSTSYKGPSLATLELSHSERVKNATMKYRQQVGLPSSYIAVHIRSEKLGHIQMSQAGYVSSCLHKMNSIVSQLKEKHNLEHVVICMDAGVRGSDSCVNCRGGIETIKILRRYQLPVTHVDPTLIGEVDDNGFVALIEMNLLSMGNHLVLVGGGSFQNQTRRHFTEYHDTHIVNRIHEVCTKR